MMDKEDLYSDKITKGSLTYAFDIKKSEEGDLYLKISESKETQSGSEHQRLLIVDEDFGDFVNALQKSVAAFKKLKASKGGKTYSLAKIRETHQQAYLPWTSEDDDKLEVLYCEGKEVKELAEIFARNAGAIRSRIKKLELKDKYGK